MTPVTTPQGYVPVFCANGECREFLRMGSPQWIGFLKPGSSGGHWCGKCRRHTFTQVPVEDSIAMMVAELVAV
jgi:hypothetical protein